MGSNFVALPADMTLHALAELIKTDRRRSQRLLPVVNADQHLIGVLTRSDVRKLLEETAGKNDVRPIGQLARANPVEAYPDEPLRVVVYRMVEKNITRMPVVENNGSRRLLGVVSLDDLLKARVRNLEDERRRERVLPLRLIFPKRVRRSNASPSISPPHEESGDGRD